MSLKDIIQKIVRGRATPEQVEMKYLLENGLTIGKNVSNYSPYAFDSEYPWLISVGDNCIISTNVKILAHDASTGRFAVHYSKVGCVNIGKNCFIGSGSIVLCNVDIGDNCIIGAGSIVSKDIPANSVAAGNPAKVICSIEEFREKHKFFLKEKPIFEKPWNEWSTATMEEKIDMKEKLKGTFGYVK